MNHMQAAILQARELFACEPSKSRYAATRVALPWFVEKCEDQMKVFNFNSRLLWERETQSSSALSQFTRVYFCEEVPESPDSIEDYIAQLRLHT